jgi:hypothetical protein
MGTEKQRKVSDDGEEQGGRTRQAGRTRRGRLTCSERNAKLENDGGLAITEKSSDFYN